VSSDWDPYLNGYRREERQDPYPPEQQYGAEQQYGQEWATPYERPQPAEYDPYQQWYQQQDEAPTGYIERVDTAGYPYAEPAYETYQTETYATETYATTSYPSYESASYESASYEETRYEETSYDEPIEPLRAEPLPRPAAPAPSAAADDQVESDTTAALLTAGLGVAIAIGALGGVRAAAAVVAAAQLLTVLGWFRLSGVGGARPMIAAAWTAGLAADAAVVYVHPFDELSPLTGALGAGFALVVLARLVSRGGDDDPGAVAALGGGMVATMLAISPVAYVVATRHLTYAAAFAALAAAAARLVWTLAGGRRGGVVATGAALALSTAFAAIGAVAGHLGLSTTSGAALGLASGATALVGARLADHGAPTRAVRRTAGVALPLVFAGFAAYVVIIATH
jgi:hypothetical protein